MKKLLVLATAVVLMISVKAEVRLPAIFGDNMVLQQQTKVKLWGWCDKGEKFTVKASWSAQRIAVQGDSNGKWSVMIPTNKGSKSPQTISFVTPKKSLKMTNILIGEVWLCSGQSNMEMPMKGFGRQPIKGGNEAILTSANPNIRLVTVKKSSVVDRQEDIVGSWGEATPELVSTFSASAYYYGRLLNQILDVPVGLIHSSWGGSTVEAWMSEDMLSGFSGINIPKVATDIKNQSQTPTTLYNGMIAPIEGYTIRGAIWYQGESNRTKPDEYVLLFGKMVEQWRAKWGQGEFPFYYCQIAPFDYSPKAPPVGKNNSAFLREAQLKASQLIPSSGMAVLLDVGEQSCIHPADKKTAAERMALLALSKTYGVKGFACEAPQYKSLTVTGEKAVVAFDKAPMGLANQYKPLNNFEIAGADKVFYPADAVIVQNGVEVSSDKVPVPVAVRYAFKDFVVGDLYGTEGLPVSSFRSDDWNE